MKKLLYILFIILIIQLIGCASEEQPDVMGEIILINEDGIVIEVETNNSDIESDKLHLKEGENVEFDDLKEGLQVKVWISEEIPYLIYPPQVIVSKIEVVD